MQRMPRLAQAQWFSGTRIMLNEDHGHAGFPRPLNQQSNAINYRFFIMRLLGKCKHPGLNIDDKKRLRHHSAALGAFFASSSWCFWIVCMAALMAAPMKRSLLSLAQLSAVSRAVFEPWIAGVTWRCHSS